MERGPIIAEIGKEAKMPDWFNDQLKQDLKTQLNLTKTTTDAQIQTALNTPDTKRMADAYFIDNTIKYEDIVDGTAFTIQKNAA